MEDSKENLCLECGEPATLDAGRCWFIDPGQDFSEIGPFCGACFALNREDLIKRARTRHQNTP